MDVITKCSYALCTGFPESIMEPCQALNCSKHLHHLCQTQLEQTLGIECGLKKRCYVCFIGENEKSTNATTNIENEKSTNATANNATLNPPASDLSQMPPLLFHPTNATANIENEKLTNADTFNESQASETISEKAGGSNIKKQTGFINSSVVLCPQLFF